MPGTNILEAGTSGNCSSSGKFCLLVHRHTGERAALLRALRGLHVLDTYGVGEQVRSSGALRSELEQANPISLLRPDEGSVPPRLCCSVDLHPSDEYRSALHEEACTAVVALFWASFGVYFDLTNNIIVPHIKMKCRGHLSDSLAWTKLLVVGVTFAAHVQHTPSGHDSFLVC